VPRVRLRGCVSGDRDKRVPTVTFTVDGQPSRAVATALCERNVAVRFGNFYARRGMTELTVEDPEDGVVRASLVHYNTVEEVDRCISELRRVIG